jgi:Ca-activated chloride channel family protein
MKTPTFTLRTWFLLSIWGLIVLVPGTARAGDFLDLWLTPDQQGERLFRDGQFLKAAKTFEDPARRAAAFYRAGDFESAAALYGAIGGADADYNRGTALVMLGRYEEAIASYDRALGERPDWAEAAQNREIARARMERLQLADDDAGGTGGELGADEIRFDDTGRVDKGGSEVLMEKEQLSTDKTMRSAWLRRVQNDPAEFLSARFAYQLYRDQAEQGGVDETD